MKTITSAVCGIAVSAALFTAAPLATASTTAPAVEPAPAPQTNLQKMVQSLEITDAQREKVFELIEDYQSNQPDINVEKVITLKKQQLTLIAQTEFDEAAMADVLDAAYSEKREAMLHQMRLKNQIYNVFTDEQKAKFKSALQQQMMSEEL
ncbi:LTXXQ motif family protein [Ferrimonas sediminum]|uniref:LTXXQ motif family protein n=1 Tax=Ferrimonas sediminum TaxID=718193 RepID=A0A1G8S4B0_9GAMM|nr:Spy/CpxP family protein refolding chaperone [Ferrimonas sediminum]SDJ23510.1 LTXXQ motif family protein [Ferrimonas sediminum]